jgi:hypothetical protein
VAVVYLPKIDIVGDGVAGRCEIQLILGRDDQLSVIGKYEVRSECLHECERTVTSQHEFRGSGTIKVIRSGNHNGTVLFVDWPILA